MGRKGLREKARKGRGRSTPQNMVVVFGQSQLKLCLLWFLLHIKSPQQISNILSTSTDENVKPATNLQDFDMSRCCTVCCRLTNSQKNTRQWSMGCTPLTTFAVLTCCTPLYNQLRKCPNAVDLMLSSILVIIPSLHSCRLPFSSHLPFPFLSPLPFLLFFSFSLPFLFLSSRFSASRTFKSS